MDWKRGERPPGKGVAIMLKGMQTPSKAEARIELLPDGRYEVQAATADMGQGASEMLTRLAAENLKCDTDQIVVCTPDTDRVPYDTRTTSSRSTHMMSRALADAARDLLDPRQASGTATSPTTAASTPTPGKGWRPRTGTRARRPPSSTWTRTPASSALSTLYASSYAGKVVNRHGAELQHEGSMILGLGTALFEELQFTEGQMTNPNLSDYNIASALDCASISHRVMELPGAEVHGLGETAVPPVPPAIGNAVASLGYDVHVLPMTPERVARPHAANEEER